VSSPAKAGDPIFNGGPLEFDGAANDHRHLLDARFSRA
jgi:hypothetical protein